MRNHLLLFYRPLIDDSIRLYWNCCVGLFCLYLKVVVVVALKTICLVVYTAYLCFGFFAKTIDLRIYRMHFQS